MFGPLRAVTPGPVADVVDRSVTTADGLLTAARVLWSTGLARPEPPTRLAKAGIALLHWGISPASGFATWAARDPHRPAVIDERGPLTFREIDDLSTRIAAGLHGLGVSSGATVALLARNSRGFVLGSVAAAKLGADVVYLNTGFAGPAIASVLADAGAAVLLHDDEFTDALVAAGVTVPRVLTWTEAAGPPGVPTLDELARTEPEPLGRPRAGRHVVLTSGTTGRARSAGRTGGLYAIAPAAALLDRIPFRARRPTVIAAPLFHMWGFAHYALAMFLGSTMVLRRRFDPVAVLADVERTRADALVAVPVMLQRMVAVDAGEREAHDVSSLRVVAVSGSALHEDVAEAFAAAYGDVVYDLYGSTEIAYVSVATPADKRAAPGTVGRPLRGTRVAILDAAGRPVEPGTVGEIYAANALTFAGYVEGGDKTRVGGLVATGDLGYLDDAGRLFVAGRSDDMIVSGGENVFPQEVEDVLRRHPAVADVAVVGVDDPEYGQRLVAHVVPATGAPADEAALRAHVRARLAGFKVPREVVFHERLPRNATGKVLRGELVRDAGPGPR